MSIIQLPTPIPATEGVFPTQKSMVVTNTLSEVTTPGFLNGIDLQSNPVTSNDLLQVLYAYNVNTQKGTYSPFTVAISATGIITLTAWSPAETDVLTTSHIFLGNASNNPQDVPMTGDVGIAFSGGNGVTTIANGAITVAKLTASLQPGGIIVHCGQLTTVGGAASESFVVNGVLDTDLIFIQIKNAGNANVSVIQVVPRTAPDGFIVTFSANPTNNCIFYYAVVRILS